MSSTQASFIGFGSALIAISTRVLEGWPSAITLAGGLGVILGLLLDKGNQ